MAGISVGEAGGGRKSSNSEIPLVPFIDLLLCCVMFLLVTAVWNQLASIDANQQQSGTTPDRPTETLKTVLRVTQDGYQLASTAGDRVDIPRVGERYDLEGLRAGLRRWKKLAPNRDDVIVAPEDGVRYEDIIDVMDIAAGEQFTQLTLSDGSGI